MAILAIDGTPKKYSASSGGNWTNIESIFDDDQNEYATSKHKSKSYQYIYFYKFNFDLPSDVTVEKIFILGRYGVRFGLAQMGCQIYWRDVDNGELEPICNSKTIGEKTGDGKLKDIKDIYYTATEILNSTTFQKKYGKNLINFLKSDNFTIAIGGKSTDNYTFSNDYYYLDDFFVMVQYRTPSYVSYTLPNGTIKKELISGTTTTLKNYSDLTSYLPTFNITYNWQDDSSTSKNKTYTNPEFIGWKERDKTGRTTVDGNLPKGTPIFEDELDYMIYTNSHSDLTDAFSYSKQHLINHYSTNGINENRVCNFSKYIKKNPTASLREQLKIISYPAGRTIDFKSEDNVMDLNLVPVWYCPITDAEIPVRNGFTFNGWYEYKPIYNGGYVDGSAKYPPYILSLEESNIIKQYTYGISIHIEGRMEDWNRIEEVSGRQLISCTDTGGWGIGKFASDGTEVYVNNNNTGTKSYIGVPLDLSSEGIWKSFDTTFNGFNLMGFLNDDYGSIARITSNGNSVIYYSTTEGNRIIIGGEAAGSGLQSSTNFIFLGCLSSAFIAPNGQKMIRYTNNSSVQKSMNLYASWKPKYYSVNMRIRNIKNIDITAVSGVTYTFLSAHIWGEQINLSAPTLNNGYKFIRWGIVGKDNKVIELSQNPNYTYTITYNDSEEIPLVAVYQFYNFYLGSQKLVGYQGDNLIKGLNF